MRHYFTDGHTWNNEELPWWFWDHHDAHIMNMDVMRMGSVPYRRRLEAREYHEARREANDKLALELKLARTINSGH